MNQSIARATTVINFYNKRGYVQVFPFDFADDKSISLLQVNLHKTQ